LDRLDVIRIEGFHEIVEVEEAGIELILMTVPDVVIIALERHSVAKLRVCVARTIDPCSAVSLFIRSKALAP
jgi:hypothetical protein